MVILWWVGITPWELPVQRWLASRENSIVIRSDIAANSSKEYQHGKRGWLVTGFMIRGCGSEKFCWDDPNVPLHSQASFYDKRCRRICLLAFLSSGTLLNSEQQQQNSWVTCIGEIQPGEISFSADKHKVIDAGEKT